MELEIIKIEDLRKGDEVIVGVNSKLKYLRLLETPRLSKTRVKWRTKIPEYINVKCEAHINVKQRTYVGYNGKVTVYDEKHFVCDDQFNTTIKQDFNDRPAFLIKRDNLEI